MKKAVIFLLIAVFVFSAAGCAPAVNPDAKPTDGNKPAELIGSSVPGTLYLTNRDKAFVITALQMVGDRAGSKEFNAREPAFVGIRSVFEKGENIDVVLSYNKGVEGECELIVCRHRSAGADPESIREAGVYSGSCKLEDRFELIFSLDGENVPAGDYDLFFLRGGAVAAYTIIRLYEPGELSGKTDAELEALMAELAL